MVNQSFSKRILSVQVRLGVFIKFLQVNGKPFVYQTKIVGSSPASYINLPFIMALQVIEQFNNNLKFRLMFWLFLRLNSLIGKVLPCQGRRCRFEPDLSRYLNERRLNLSKTRYFLNIVCKHLSILLTQSHLQSLTINLIGIKVKIRI